MQTIPLTHHQSSRSGNAAVRIIVVFFAVIGLCILLCCGGGFFLLEKGFMAFKEGVEQYAASIEKGKVNQMHAAAGETIKNSYFTEEEKTTAYAELKRIHQAYLDQVDENISAARVSFDAVLQKHLLLIAQIRAIKETYLPESELTDEEKAAGAKTCDRVMCALMNNMTGGHVNDALGIETGTFLMLFKEQPESADVVPAKVDEELLLEGENEPEESVEDDWPPAPEMPVDIIDTNEKLREVLAYLNGYIDDHQVPEEIECEIDIIGTIKRDVDEYLQNNF